MPKHKRKFKVLKAKGGKDASKSDFTTGFEGSPEMGANKTAATFGPSGGGDNNTGQKTTTTVNTGGSDNKSGGFKIPVIGPITAGLRLVQELTTGKKEQKLEKNYGPYTKVQKVSVPAAGGNDRPAQQLCPDGTTPPCKSPVTQIKQPVTKPNQFLTGFQSYDDGGEIVISGNVDKDLL